MIAMLVSQVGTYIQIVAEGWLVYDLTNSAFTLGLVGFVAMIPLGPWALVTGTLADRMSRKKLLALAQFGEALPPLVLASLIWTGNIQVWHVIVSSVIMGAMSTLDFTSRTSLIYSLVERDEIESGVALTASLMNVSRVIGPAIAGVLIAVIGTGMAFALNGLSFLFVLLVLAFIRAPQRPALQLRGSVLPSLIEAGKHIYGDRNILILITLMVLASVFVMPYQTLLPVFARDLLESGPETLGFLTAAAGVGAVIAAFVLGIQPPMPSRQRLRLALGLTLGLCPAAAAFAFSRDLLVSTLLLAVVSGGFVALRTISFTYIHLRTDDDLRGRMSSILQLTMVSTVRVGGLFIGSTASVLGAPVSLGLGALACFMLSLTTIGFIRRSWTLVPKAE